MRLTAQGIHAETAIANNILGKMTSTKSLQIIVTNVKAFHKIAFTKRNHFLFNLSEY